MGNYNSQYENYYRNLQNRSIRTSSYYKSSGFNRKNLGEKIIKKIEFQLIGTLVLFLAVFSLRQVITPETKAACNYIKYTVSYNYDYSQILSYIEGFNLNDVETYASKIDMDSLKNQSVDYIENLKARVTGEKTFGAKIKQEYCLPINGKIASHFKQKDKDVLGNQYLNNGVDIKANSDLDVKAIYDGTVEKVGEDKDFGKYVMVDNGDGVESKYSNMDSFEVQRGDGVTKGEVLGKVKKNDDASKSYLHFEIMYMGEDQDPENYFTFK
ncbi:peptidase M23 [Clostridium acetobutylicum]|nr:peptidase M23 [Clostridium acetobutylicum]